MSTQFEILKNDEYILGVDERSGKFDIYLEEYVNGEYSYTNTFFTQLSLETLEHLGLILMQIVSYHSPQTCLFDKLKLEYVKTSIDLNKEF